MMRLNSLLAVCVLMFAFSCKKKEQDKVETNNFDRTSMLVNYSDNVITPSLTDFSTAANNLYNVTLLFSQNPTQSRLDSLQNELKTTFIAWQYCSAIRFGPPLEQFGEGDVFPKVDYIDIFPSNPEAIENFIKNNFQNLNDIDLPSRGLNALDYLLFDLNDNDSTILNNFKASPNRINYLKLIAMDVKNRSNAAVAGWHTYKSDFISNNGTSATSSTALLMKQLIVDYENLKNYKVGIPSGRVVQNGQPVFYSNQVEAYYSGYSFDCMKNNFYAIENLWYGRNKRGYDGPGLQEYLLETSGGPEIAVATVQQFEIIRTKLNGLPSGRFSELLKSNPAQAQELYLELQKFTRHIKSEMVSVLGVYITYASGDGD
ncbi:MAG: imelysin family protein [Opitutaceae bacterium]|nr:imelysin family protein [Cytophagales bacterium]